MDNDNYMFNDYIIKLNELKKTHPNISRIWVYYITQKRNELLRSLHDCNVMINNISEYNIEDMSMYNIILLKSFLISNVNNNNEQSNNSL